MDDWKHIKVYNSGKSDLALSILTHFEKQLPPEVARYIRVEREMAQENIKEANNKGKQS